MLEQVGIAVAAACVGWCLGWASARATDWLQAADELPLAAHGAFVRDALVQVGGAAAWVLAYVLIGGEWWRWVSAAVLTVPLIQVAVTDLRHRYVYTLIAGAGLVLGLVLGPIARDAEWWTSAAGALGGFISFGALYLLGRLIYRGGEPLARGDITIAAMVGAVAGTCTASALVLGVLFGGVFAIGVWIVRRSRHAYLPYGPGLCLGGLLSLFRC